MSEPGSSLSAASGSYSLDPSPVDLSLLALLGSRRYDELNEVIKQGICRTYKQEMYGACQSLLENERVLGRVIPWDEDEEAQDMPENEDDWFRDPTTLTSFELFQEMSKLSIKINKQKKLNERAASDVEILTLAKSSLDLELGFKLVALIAEEQKEE